ncbi:MAG: hypothetical protein PHX60_09835 [Giesbergeria sp.]|uniref:hypothetical protein n=1 Tax=Giesbergeria sp. TaxID=2818473 RepID=UPI00261904D6|nr:hypothetical protein [Giesbergeria sp.]MDD2609977.1 hypothetical protein [Giesbergeria sp.]
MPTIARPCGQFGQTFGLGGAGLLEQWRGPEPTQWEPIKPCGVAWVGAMLAHTVTDMPRAAINRASARKPCLQSEQHHPSYHLDYPGAPASC